MINECTTCGKPLHEVPWKCKSCAKRFCSEHRLPEGHGCAAPSHRVPTVARYATGVQR